jgi:hypothetical protein
MTGDIKEPGSFQIGKEVEVVKGFGAGQRFVISEKHGGDAMYSAPGLPWYPASSLKHVEKEPKLKIGDLVEVIGRTSINESGNEGRRFRITVQNKHSGNFSGNGESWYPASSLALVEEGLKIGDLVQVIDQPKGCRDHETGTVSRITAIGPQGGYEVDKFFYEGHSLRKLSAKEALCHLTKLPSFTAEQRLDSLEESLEEIDQYQTILRDNGAKRFCRIGERLDDIEHRLAFVEAWQEEREEYNYGYMIEKAEARITTLERENRELFEAVCKLQTKGA